MGEPRDKVSFKNKIIWLVWIFQIETILKTDRKNIKNYIYVLRHENPGGTKIKSQIEKLNFF